MTSYDLTIGFVFALLAGLTLYAYVTLLRVQHTASTQILALTLSLKKEQRLTTALREMLAAIGVETIVQPTEGDYLLTFKAHFPPPNITHALRAWRGPVRH